MRPPASFGALLGLAIALLHAQVVVAQIFHLWALPAPGNYSSTILFTYYVGWTEDRSTVEFDGVYGHSTSSSLPDASLTKYKGLRLTLIRNRDLPERVYCSHDGELLVRASAGDTSTTAAAEARKEEPFMHTEVVSFASADHVSKASITMPGIYVLVLSNCGEVHEARVSGTVTVRHGYGLLPGGYYQTMTFYGGALAAYCLFMVAWLVLCLVFETFVVHKAVAAVLVFGFCESLSHYVFFSSLNATGAPSVVQFSWFVFFSGMRPAVAYGFALALVSGWRLWRDGLTRKEILCYSVLALGCLLLFPVPMLQKARYAPAFGEWPLSTNHELSWPTQMLTSVLLSAVFALIAATVVDRIWNLEDDTSPFLPAIRDRLRCTTMIITSLLVVTSVTFLLAAQTLGRGEEGWTYAWTSEVDGCAQFLLSVLVVMCLWAPGVVGKPSSYLTVGDGAGTHGQVEQVAFTGEDEEACIEAAKEDAEEEAPIKDAQEAEGPEAEVIGAVAIE